MADNPLHYKDLLVPDNSIEKAIEQLNELNQAYDASIKKIKSRAEEVQKNLQSLSGATQQQQEEIKKASIEAADLAKKEAQAKKEQAKVELELQKIETEKLKQQKLINQQSKTLKITTEEAIELSKKEVKSINEANEANKKLRAAVRQITDAEDKEGKIRKQLNSAILLNTQYIQRNSDAMVKQKMNIGNYTESIKQAFYEIKNGNASMKNFGIVATNFSKIMGAQVAGGLREVTSGVGNMIKGFVGAQLVLKGISSFVGAVKEGASTIVDFQAANSRLAAILGTTADGIKELREDALRLGSATAYTASQVTDLQTELAKLGFTQQEIVQSTSGILKFATAVGTDLGSAAQVAGAAIRAFGADTSETNRYVATMAVATTKSALSFADLQTSLSTIAPVAKAFGFTIEDTVTLMGALKNAGFDASTAATAARNILLNLADSSGKLAQTLGQPIKNLDDMSVAFAKLRDKGIDLATALDLTDKRSVAAFEAFMTAADGLTSLRDSVTDVEGELYKMSDTMADNVAGSIKKMQSAWEGLVLTFSNSTGVMQNVIDFITKGINEIAYSMKSLDEQNKVLENEAIQTADTTMAEFSVITERLKQLRASYEEYQKGGMDASQAAVTAKQEMIDELSAEIEKEKKIYDEEYKKQLKLQDDYQNASFIKQALFLEKTDKQYKDAIRKQGELLAQISAQRYQAEAKLRAVQAADLDEGKATTGNGVQVKGGKQKKTADRTQQIESKNLSITKELYASENALIKDGMEKERKTLVDAYNQQVAELQNKLKNDKDLTEESRENINQIILYKQEKLNQDMLALESKGRQTQLQKEQAELNLRLAATEKNTKDENELRLQLIENARQQELEKNSQLTESMRQDEALINAKYDKERQDQEKKFFYADELLRFDQQQALAQSEFDLLKKTEDEKTLYKLQAERDRLAKLIELAKAGYKDIGEAELSTMQNNLNKLDKEISGVGKKAGKKDIYDLVGIKLDSDQKQAISESVGFSIEQLGSLLDAQLQLKEQALQNAQEETEAAKSKVEKEIEARNNGYANDVATAQKELELAKQNEQKALKEKQKAQKAQAALDTLTQTSSLITASANIWKSLSSIPIVGHALAIAAVASMWASFAAAKIKAKEVTTSTEYGEGGMEVLEGGSHQSGNDVDMGTMPDGSPRRAEGGEAFAIINKRNTRKYRKTLPGIIKSLNDGTFEKKYINAFGSDGLAINVSGLTFDSRRLEKDVRDIKEQGKRRYILDGQGRMIETYRNLRRVYG